MLRDIDPIKAPIVLGGENTYLRYNLNAHLYLEHYYPNIEEFMAKDSDNWSLEDVLHLLRAGLMDSHFEENEQAISEREFSKVKPSLASVGRLIDQTGLVEITLMVLEAILSSYPQVPVGAENFQTGAKENPQTLA